MPADKTYREGCERDLAAANAKGCNTPYVALFECIKKASPTQGCQQDGRFQAMNVCQNEFNANLQCTLKK
jgi:hypothetical protein